MEHEAITFDAKHLRLPFFCQVTGASHTGKSYFVANMVLKRQFTLQEPVTKIIWCFSVHQPLYKKIKMLDPSIQFRQDLNFVPDREKIQRADGSYEPVLLIVDDLGVEALKSQMFYNLAVKHCHHWNISVFYITQHIFSDEKNSKKINDQCSYMSIFKSPRDESSVGVVATQSFRSTRKAFLEAYEHATEVSFQCLFLDLTAQCPKSLRMRGDILHPHPIIYVPKGI
jgi:hypothetical protein